MKWILVLTLICDVGLGWTHVALNIGGWQRSTISVDFNPADCTVDTATLEAIIDDAIRVWNGVPTSGIVLTRNPVASTLTRPDFTTGTATSPLIICDSGFSSNTSADPDYVPAATQVSTDSTGYLDAGLIALNAEVGTGAEISQISEALLTVILAHEIGHVLGLGHSGQSDALMYYSVAGKTEAVLALDDMDGLSQLYPRSEFGAGAYGCAAVHGSGSPRSLWWLVLFLSLVLTAGRLTWLRPARLRALRERPLSDAFPRPSSEWQPS